MIGVGRPALSNFLNGRAALSPEMAARLQRVFGVDGEDLKARQTGYDAAVRRNDQVISATTRAFVPPFLMATANDIENWSDTHRSRDQLAVLLRMLINSTCGTLELVDFPGNDDAQRRGWDGRVETSEGNPWVPEGSSGWEFGTNQRVARKANDEYAKRTASADQAERESTTFVFVTPRRWPGKSTWLRDRRAEAKWRNVLAWDASDIEQWLEQSIPAQAWFAGCRGITLSGVKSLERCWTEWSAPCKPSFSEEIFAEAISVFGERVRSHLRDGTDGILRIAADSRQEGLAFLAALLSGPDDGSDGLGDRVVAFTKPGPLSELAVGSPGFLPVITDPEVEVELAESGCNLKVIVIEPRTAVQDASGITLEPLSAGAFRKGLALMGLDDDRTRRLDRESGRSLTVLRRRLAQSEAIRSPSWSSEEDLARVLAPMMFAGAWVTTNDADRHLMEELAGCGYDQLEADFTRLFNLEDSPVWSVGGFHGVVSKIDALYGVHRWMPSEQIDRFVDVAKVVLSERDPALDLPEREQWAAVLHGKARKISSPMRKGVGESLVLLAIHGDRLFSHRIDLRPAQKVASLVRRLLEPMSADKLVSQGSNLPLYAEAAPEMFLDIFEGDLARSDPAVAALMRPAGDIMFGRSDRVGLLWALELLAWKPEWLDRVITVLAELAEREPDDNLANKPSESLHAIFRSWMPQTAAPLELRTAVFDRLALRHPMICWHIATSQFEPGPKTGTYSHKPTWRDYALGVGEPVTKREWHAFAAHCIKLCLDWPSHTRETLADLMRSIERWESSDLAKLEMAVAEWAERAQDKDRAWLRERIRVSTQRTIRRKSRGISSQASANESVLAAQKAFEVLEPTDPVWKHAWLFENLWVDESWDDLDEKIDLKTRAKRNEALRLEAMREVTAAEGSAGILRLAFSGNAADVAGATAAKTIENESARDVFVRSVLEDGHVLTSVPHQFLISGFLRGVGETCAIRLIEALWPDYREIVGVKLLCLCSFNRLVWSTVEGMGKAVEDKYWADIQPSWRQHTEEDINYTVSRLLAAGRPQAAMDYAHLDWRRVESGHIHRILTGLPLSNEERYRNAAFDVHGIQQAFEVLNQRDALSRAELARLEFLYLDLFWFEEGGLPNLEKEIEANPQLFCQAITLVYRRENEDKREPSKGERNAAQSAYRLLGKLTRIPGHDSNEVLNADRLTDWIRKAQQLCDASGRRRAGDHHIGQLLSKAPAGDDGVWPCPTVRDTLEAVWNDDIGEGFHIGRRNARGAHWRVEGGAQERELTEQYEEWARVCDYANPRVATALRQLASSYRSEGHWQDQEAAVQRRLGY